MEPSGRNRWQPVANRAAMKRGGARSPARGLRGGVRGVAWPTGAVRPDHPSGSCGSMEKAAEFQEGWWGVRRVRAISTLQPGRLAVVRSRVLPRCLLHDLYGGDDHAYRPL
jgi:hypothetical protein